MSAPRTRRRRAMLRVHRASRGDWLVEGLAEVLAQPAGADPMIPEVVAVPTRGVERWLSQRLALRLGAEAERFDGVCANILFPFPGTLVGQAMGAATGVDPAQDPWEPERAVWPLLEVVEARIGEPWLATLAIHLGLGGDDPDEARQARRFATVRHLADLYDHYGVHRPAMVRSWAAGEDLDGEGARLPADVCWQARLWRALRAEVGIPSPAQRMADGCRTIAADPSAVALPDRISLFGLTRLPPSYLEVLTAIGAHRQVDLWLLHPSAALWSQLAVTANNRPVLVPRRRDRSAAQVRNPLLATWGRDAREMQLVLAAAGVTNGDARPDAEAPATVLGRIQADIRADREPAWRDGRGGADDLRPVLEEQDRSLQVHACHGRGRQVEVLRDAILHVLADDPTLEPRDVIVMCPDIDAFAPLIQATFAQDVSEQEDQAEIVAQAATLVPTGQLHVRLADRSIRQTNPVFAALTELLVLADGRATASSLLSFIGSAPLRRRFELDDDDLARIDGWVRDAGARWGFDAASRRPYHLDRVPDGTWMAALNRILVGVAVSEDDLRLVGDTLPLDDVGSGDVELVGRLAELTDRLAAVVEQLRQAQTLRSWVSTLERAADLLMAADPNEEWQRAQLQGVLDEVLTAEAAHGSTGVVLSLPEVRTLLADRLRGRPTRANFRTGHLTMCTLVPMRSVPHRVVCLLGLDDGYFPRHGAADGDDVLRFEPMVGDRDARSEDRQLLLDAVLAAEDHLIITYTGRDERTNAVRSPAVPVGELLDVAARTVRPGPRTGPDRIGANGLGTVRDRIVVHHPLQPFDVRNFSSGALRTATPWSFDRHALAGAVALADRQSATTRPPTLSTNRPAPPTPEVLAAGNLLEPARSQQVSVDDLVQFVRHPVRAFLRQRLGVTVPGDWPPPGDGLAIELEPQQAWKVGNRLITLRLAGADPDACRRAEVARGGLPPGTLGERVLDELLPRVEALVAAAGTGTPAAVEVAVDLGGRSVTGTVSEVFGDELRAVSYSQLAAGHRLSSWVPLVALSAAAPERPWRARVIGRGRQGQPAISVLGPLGPDSTARRETSRRILDRLLQLYDLGLRVALPLPCKTAAAWAGARRSGGDADAAARGEWTTSRLDFAAEDQDAAHLVAFGGVLGFDDLLGIADRLEWPAEMGPGSGAGDEGGRAGDRSAFGWLAGRLWDDLLEWETRL